jgi:hypothetical protein
MLVPGFERQTWQCSACFEVEERFVFIREKAAPAETPLQPVQSDPNAKVPKGSDNEERSIIPDAKEQASSGDSPAVSDGGPVPLTDAETASERGATSSPAGQAFRETLNLPPASEEMEAEPVKVDVAKSMQGDVQKRAATPSTSEETKAHTLYSESPLVPVDTPPAIAPEEPHAPASAWGRAVAKLRSWQTEKGGRRQQ